MIMAENCLSSLNAPDGGVVTWCDDTDNGVVQLFAAIERPPEK